MEVFKPRVFIFPILIYGHRGSGKSYRANTIAHALGG
jgi:transcriptional regulator with AAA-type ATPase domain